MYNLPLVNYYIKRPEIRCIHGINKIHNKSTFKYMRTLHLCYITGLIITLVVCTSFLNFYMGRNSVIDNTHDELVKLCKKVETMALQKDLTDLLHRLCSRTQYQSSHIYRQTCDDRVIYDHSMIPFKIPPRNVDKDSPYRVRIGYVIIVHSSKTMEHSKILLKQIYNQYDQFVIHVDKKVSNDNIYHYKKWMHAFQDTTNLHVMQIHEGSWGGISLVRILIDGIRLLLNCDKIINLSGESFPIKTRQQMDNILIDMGDSNVASSYGLRITSGIYIDDKEKQARIRETNLDLKDVYFGAQWVILNRDFAHYIIHSEYANQLLDTFLKIWIPDESYVPTLLMNGPFKDRVNTSTFSIHEKWSKDTTLGICSPFTLENWLGYHPCELVEKDFDMLIASPALFSRKIYDLGLIEKIRSYLHKQEQYE
jgi:hypothetical protein